MKTTLNFASRACKKLIEPRGMDENTRRREFIVNIILLGSIVLACFLFTSASINFIDLGAKYDGIAIPYLAAIVVLFVLIFLVSRKGNHRTASYLLVGTYFGGALFETITWGPELPEATMPYTLVIIMAYVLVGSRFGFIMTGVVGSILILTSWLEEKGLLHPDLAWKLEPTDVSDSVEQAMIYMLIMLISWLSAREIAKSLSRALTSEEALRTERDNLEATLAERTRELHNAQAVKIADIYRFVEFGKLASGIFHDLMSPLTSVALSIEELHDTSPTSQNEHISKAVFASRSIQKYMEALRRQMSMHEKKETFLPCEITREAILLLEYKARKLATTISFSSENAGDICLYGNPLKFQQILINIISNALYACMNARIREIRIKLWEENSVLKLSVSDSGCGMSDTESQRIFEPFFTTRQGSEGSGLGLSITKTIIEHDFKGTISVKSSMEKGSTFTLTFPFPKAVAPNLP